MAFLDLMKLHAYNHLQAYIFVSYVILTNPLGTGEALPSYMLMLLRGIRDYSSKRIQTC